MKKVNVQYVVLGGTGNIGKRIAEALRSEGAKVRVVARKGADLNGNLEDAAFLAKAFEGADAAFTMIPPSYASPDPRGDQDRQGIAIAKALAASSITHVVNLSSIGAQLPEKTGPIAGLHFQEARLDAIAKLNVVHLRPAFFMENLLQQVGLIQSAGITGTPLRPDVKFPIIATQDIAAVAADLLRGLAFTGKQVLELHGQRDVSMGEVTEIFAKALKRPDLKYIAFPYEAAEKGMVEAGVSLPMAKLFNEMYAAFNTGLTNPTQPRSKSTTTPTSIEAFTEKVIAPALN